MQPSPPAAQPPEQEGVRPRKVQRGDAPGPDDRCLDDVHALATRSVQPAVFAPRAPSGARGPPSASATLERVTATLERVTLRLQGAEQDTVR